MTENEDADEGPIAPKRRGGLPKPPAVILRRVYREAAEEHRPQEDATSRAVRLAVAPLDVGERDGRLILAEWATSKRREWVVRDVAPKAQGNHRKLTALGDADAREREFVPLNHTERTHVYRFRVDDSRALDLVTLRKQFSQAKPVGKLRFA